MNKKKEIVPKLRFPEFIFKEFKEQWKMVKCGEVLREVSVRNKDDRETNIISVTNTRGFTKQNEFFGKIVASKDTTNYKIIHKNQFAYNPARINVGSIALLKDFDIGILSPMYVVFECKHLLSAEYLNHWLKSYFFMGVLEDYLSGSVRKSLNFKDMEQISIFLPPLKEQQKIADCLSSTDDLIEAESRKLKVLEKYKKGLMQKLLTPKIRFKEFKEQWKVVKLKEVCSAIAPPKKINKQKYLSFGKFPIIDQGQKYIIGYTNDESAVLDFDSYVIFGDHTLEIKYFHGKFAQGADGIKILKASSDILPKILYYVMCNFRIPSDGYKRHWNRMKNIQIPLPPLKEQQKIADCLSEVDTMIKEQSNKVEQLKVHKKGLMQGLFPSFEEVDV